jgi:hypothetical protein
LTLQRFAKWWSLASLLAVLVAVALTYISAHGEGHLPKHHPGPAISAIAFAVVPLTVKGERKTWHWFYKIALSASAVVLAIVVSRIS